MCVINQSNQQQYLDIYYIPVYSTNNTQVLPVNQSDHIFMKHQPTTSINLIGYLFQSYYVPTRYQSITSFSLPKIFTNPITYLLDINQSHPSPYQRSSPIRLHTVLTRYQSITSISFLKITNQITCLLNINQSHLSTY